LIINTLHIAKTEESSTFVASNGESSLKTLAGKRIASDAGELPLKYSTGEQKSTRFSARYSKQR
jgi:hypothetical protein